MKHSINWKVFSVLLTLSLVSVACVFPYVLTVQGELLETVGVPIRLLFLIQLLQSAVLFSIAIYFGLLLTKAIHFRLPLLEALTSEGAPRQVLNGMAGKSALLGAGAAILIYAIDALFTVAGVTISTHRVYAPAWQTLLAAVYGGVTEEILMRLFLMTLLIWIGMKLLRQTAPVKTVIIISIVLAAVIFGLGHLPITASLTTLNAPVIGRAVVLNGIGGVVFGWLFWKHGLESAMIAHFTADIVLLTLLPLLVR